MIRQLIHWFTSKKVQPEEGKALLQAITE
eukprot:SAG11_NODE_23463_length_388_cov_0.795848_1_plen_28_part_10